MKYIITATTAIVIAAAAFIAGQTTATTATAEDLQAEFDRGMKAGQEYEAWFCENEVATTVPSSDAP